MQERIINIEVLNHEQSGLMVAVSDDLPGLYVHGTSFEEVRSRVPAAIKSLVSASEDMDVEVHEG